MKWKVLVICAISQIFALNFSVWKTEDISQGHKHKETHMMLPFLMNWHTFNRVKGA